MKKLSKKEKHFCEEQMFNLYYEWFRLYKTGNSRAFSLIYWIGTVYERVVSEKAAISWAKRMYKRSGTIV